jgi:hypothetical protein
MAEVYPPGFHSNVKFRDREEDDGLSEARIGSQVGYMQDSLAKLMELVHILSDRLNPILLPNDILTQSIETASPPRKPASELSNTLDDMNGQISRLQRMVSTLTERVQL